MIRLLVRVHGTLRLAQPTLADVYSCTEAVTVVVSGHVVQRVALVHHSEKVPCSKVSLGLDVHAGKS